MVKQIIIIKTINPQHEPPPEPQPPIHFVPEVVKRKKKKQKQEMDQILSQQHVGLNFYQRTVSGPEARGGTYVPPLFGKNRFHESCPLNELYTTFIKKGYTPQTAHQCAVTSFITTVRPKMIAYFKAHPLQNPRQLHIVGPVDDKTSGCYMFMRKMQNENPFRMPITVIITSPGGRADLGQALADHILSCTEDVYTVALGQVASAAAWIFFCGYPRYMTAGASILVHKTKMTHLARVDVRDIERILKNVNRYNEKLLHTLKCMVPSTFYAFLKKHVTDNMGGNEDLVLFKKEMVEYGLIFKGGILDDWDCQGDQAQNQTSFVGPSIASLFLRM